MDSLLRDKAKQPIPQQKFSDFRVSRMGDRETYLSVSSVRGIHGYLVPEWVELDLSEKNMACIESYWQILKRPMKLYL